jgi:hypothetical protein
MPENNLIELRCIKKLIPRGGIEHITHAGNSYGVWSRERIIDWIERKEFEFFTYVDKRFAPVRVRREAGWAPHLCTQVDGKWTEDLLSLPTYTDSEEAAMTTQEQA